MWHVAARVGSIMRIRIVSGLLACIFVLALVGCSSSGLEGTWESDFGQVTVWEKDGTYREYGYDDDLILMGEYTLEDVGGGVWAYEGTITHYKDYGEYWLDGEVWDLDDEDLWDSFGDDDVWDEVYDDIEDAMYEARSTGKAQTIRDGYGGRRTIEWRLRPLEESSPPIEYYVVREGRQAHFYTSSDGHAEGDTPRMTLTRK